MNKIKKEYSKWQKESVVNGNLVAENNQNIPCSSSNWEQVFECSQKINADTKVNFGRQSLELVSEKSGVFTYKITSRGLMWDADVINIVMGFTGNTKDLLVENCIKLQLTQLNIV